MKKTALSILLCLVCFLVSAQTNFRGLAYKDALTTAKTENKKVFMDFYTDWCGPCKMMSREIFPQKSVGDYMNKNFVCIKVNAEKGDGVALAKRYKINAYPTMVVIDMDEKELGRIVGSQSADELTNKLDQLIDPSKKPETIRKRYEQGERTPNVVKAYAANSIDELLRSDLSKDEKIKKYDSIVNLVQDYFSKLPDTDRVKPENMFVYTSYTEDPFSPSARFYYTSLNKFKEPQKSEVDSIMRKRYEQYLCGLMGGERKYDAAHFEQLKKEIHKLGIDKGKDFLAVYALVEGEAKNDKLTYIRLCERYYKELPSDMQGYFMTHFSAHFQDVPKDVRDAAAAFVRKHIGELPVNMMYSTVIGLADIEQYGK